MLTVSAARTQPIIVNATADMMKEHFLPVARKLREQSLNMRKEEEEFHAETRRLQHRKEGGEVESEIQEVCAAFVAFKGCTTPPRGGVVVRALDLQPIGRRPFLRPLSP